MSGALGQKDQKEAEENFDDWTKYAKDFDVFFKREFCLHEFVKKHKHDRILVIGMGGGCDIFSAYSVVLELKDKLEDKIDVLYGNTKGAKFLNKQDGSHKEVVSCLYMVPEKEVVLEKGCDKEWYGTSLLTQSIPRDKKGNGSPFIFVLPSKLKKEDEVAKATDENSKAILKTFAKLKPDLIIGVDTGGDCITGGIDYEGHFELGRDVQMMKAIQRSGINHLIMAFGPGADGESTMKKMNDSVMGLDKQGFYLGAFKLHEVVKRIQKFTANVSQTRTPNHIMRATLGKPTDGKVVDGVEYMKIKRWLAVRWLPRKWLTYALVFQFDHPEQEEEAKLSLDSPVSSLNAKKDGKVESLDLEIREVEEQKR